MSTMMDELYFWRGKTITNQPYLELLHLDVKEQVLVYLRHAVLLTVLHEVLVEVQHGEGGLALGMEGCCAKRRERERGG